MEKIIEVIKACRSKWLTTLEDLTTDQLNQIPTGFNNNLAWQLGHVVVSQQLLCYKLSGNALLIDEQLVDMYRNGSKPERYITAEEIDQMKTYLLSTIDQLATDLGTDKFQNFTSYTISTYPGFKLEKITDSVKFIVSHDALHYGCSLMLKKLV